MHAAEHETSPNGRRLTGSMLDSSGVAIERMPGLALILEQFAANIADALRPLLGDGVSGSITDISPAGVFDVAGQSKGRPAAVLRCDELDASLLIVLDLAATDFVVLSIFAGSEPMRTDPPVAPPDRPRTNIENRLLSEFAESIGRALETSFAPSARAAFTFSGLQTLTDANILGRRDTPAVAAHLRVVTGAGSCACIVLLPQPLLQSLRQELSIEPSAAAVASDPRWTRQMESGVAKARLPVTAIMEEVEMTLADVAAFRVGRVVALRGGGNGRVRLECSGRGVFWGRLGQGEGRYSIEIDDPIDDAETEIDALFNR
jgi:flagellar motor switch protein FliM